MQGWAWVDVAGWLYTEIVYPSKTVTHPSTNRGRRRVTLMRRTTLPLRQTAIGSALNQDIPFPVVLKNASTTTRV